VRRVGGGAMSFMPTAAVYHPAGGALPSEAVRHITAKLEADVLHTFSTGSTRSAMLEASPGLLPA